MTSKQINLQSREMQFASAVIGGSFIMMTLGTNYCLGGLSPYIVSRLRAGNLTGAATISWDLVHTGSIVWVFVLAALFQGVGMLASGFLVAKLPCDRRWSVLTGCLLSSLGTCLSGVTVCVSLGLVVLTSGAIFGFGQGLAYATIIDSVTSWTDDRKGLVTGVLVSSFAIGAIIFLPVQSKIINPDNLTPDWTVGSDRLFLQSAVTDRVPYSFFVMSAVYVAIQVTFVGLIRRRHQSGSVETEPPVTGESEASEATLLIADGPSEKSPASTVGLQELPQSPITEAPLTFEASTWTLRRAVKSLPFYVMGVSIFFLTPASIVLPTMDKAYGETFVFNDMLLSVLVGVSSAFNAVGRIAAGAMIDRFHFRVCVLIQGLLLALLHALMPLSTLTHPALYFLLICLVHFVFSGIFVYFPYAVEGLFGSQLFPQVYGLVFLFKAVSGALVAVVTTTSLHWIGWTGLMLLVTVTSGIGGAVILLYNSDRWRLTVSLL